jgi:hypothetical protein
MWRTNCFFQAGAIPACLPHRLPTARANLTKAHLLRPPVFGRSDLNYPDAPGELAAGARNRVIGPGKVLNRVPWLARILEKPFRLPSARTRSFNRWPGNCPGTQGRGSNRDRLPARHTFLKEDGTIACEERTTVSFESTPRSGVLVTIHTPQGSVTGPGYTLDRE